MSLQVHLITDGYMIVYGLGPIMQFNTPYLWHVAIDVWEICIDLVQFSIPLPFLYRYMHLCR